MVLRRLVGLGVLCACSTTTEPGLIGDSDASPTKILGGGLTACSSNVETFALPATPAGIQGTPFPSVTGASVPCANSTSTFDYELADVNGDTQADLVVTRTCDDANIGTSAWLVYLNTTSGFAAPASYALPTFPDSASCVQSGLIDVDGDLNADLVVTSLCSDMSVGTSRWLVFHNTGTAFDLSAQSYVLPGNAGLHAFPSFEADAADCSATAPAFAFFDITGDLIPDIVETVACDDDTVGVTHWRVYPGTATGVSAPISFTLPGSYLLTKPRSGSLGCNAYGLSSPSYTVVDFDGDRRPDLVVTQSCSDASAGTTHWLIFANQGAAFASQPTAPTLPNIGPVPTGAFDAANGSVQCTGSSSSVTHAFVDFDGDLKPDLVATETCSDAMVGASYWLLMRNTGTTFDGPETFALPTALGASSSNLANDLSGDLTCATSHATAAFGASYLLGTALDLVVTTSCTDSSVGLSRWIAAVPTCSSM